MKNILFIILCICSTNVLIAQEEASSAKKTKLEIRLSNGVSLPVGEYVSSEGTISDYATNGYKGALDISLKLSKSFGVAFIANYNMVATDANKKAEEYLNSNPSYTSVTVESGPYSVMSFMLAPEYSIHLGEKFNVQGQLSLGISNVQAADETITVSSASPYVDTRTGGSSNSASYQGKLSFNFMPSSSFGLGLYGSYFATDAMFTVEEVDLKQSISTGEVGLQLIFGF